MIFISTPMYPIKGKGKDQMNLIKGLKGGKKKKMGIQKEI